MAKQGKVLFIIHDIYQDDNAFSLGPAYMAAVLRKKDIDVKICSQDVFHYTNKELVEIFLKNESYDLIGIGFLAARFKETVLELCQIVNEYKKNAWLVLGSSGPSATPKYMLQVTGADVIAIGEAEETIVRLLECKVNGGRDLFKVEGIAYRDGDRAIINQRRKPVQNLDTLPFPEWDLFPMDKYSTCFKFTGMDDNDHALAIITSRGCFNQCNFCYRMEKGIRLRAIDNIVQEIKILNERYGITYFSIQDELFVVSKRRLIEFKKRLKEYNLKIKFSCNARVNIFDKEIADYLKECGCALLNLGMESSDQKVLDIMRKDTTVEENIKAARLAKDAGLGIGLNFLWGNIEDTEDSLRGNVKLIKELNAYYQLRTIRPVTPYPGCDLYYEAIKRRLLSGPDDFFKRFKNSDLLTVNFTDIPDREFYRLLFEANRELILDHYEHTTQNMEEADSLISQFYSLYFEGNYKFRGARHYERAKQQ